MGFDFKGFSNNNVDFEKTNVVFNSTKNVLLVAPLFEMGIKMVSKWDL